jgi:hypothetical protein
MSVREYDAGAETAGHAIGQGDACDEGMAASLAAELDTIMLLAFARRRDLDSVVVRLAARFGETTVVVNVFVSADDEALRAEIRGQVAEALVRCGWTIATGRRAERRMWTLMSVHRGDYTAHAIGSVLARGET